MADVELETLGAVIKTAYEGQDDTNAFTNDEKTKLTGIESGAQVNTVSSVAGKTGAVSLVKADVSLGNVDNTADTAKPVSTAQQTALDAKQNTLVSGTNIKTVNGNSLLGAGDIEISGGGGGTVTSVALSVPTGLEVTGSPITGAGTFVISLATGYVIPLQATLDGKLSTSATTDEITEGDVNKYNVQADWNGSGLAAILNKPTFATVASTGSYDDLIDKPSIPNGTVTSVALTVPAGLIVGGSPITGAGTFEISLDTGRVIPTQAEIDGKVASNPTGVTGADAVTNCMTLTTAEYGAITPNASTLYFITDAT